MQGFSRPRVILVYFFLLSYNFQFGLRTEDQIRFSNELGICTQLSTLASVRVKKKLTPLLEP